MYLSFNFRTRATALLEQVGKIRVAEDFLEWAGNIDGMQQAALRSEYIKSVDNQEIHNHMWHHGHNGICFLLNTYLDTRLFKYRVWTDAPDTTAYQKGLLTQIKNLKARVKELEESLAEIDS